MGKFSFQMNVWFTSAPYLEMFSEAKQNAHYMLEMQDHPPHMMIVHVTASYIIGPYFFDGTLSGVACIKCGIMLNQSQATMGLCNRCHFSKIVLQHIHPDCV